MKKQDKTVDAFFALLRAGLWEQSVRLLPFSPIDFDAIFQLAEEQSVEGLIAEGLERVEDIKVSKPQAVPFITKVISFENRNSAMNHFIGRITKQMNSSDIDFVLIKGQGIATCYNRPQWRVAGDVDFLFNESSLSLAKSLLCPLAKNHSHLDPEDQHVNVTIDEWEIELHGNLHTGISRRIDHVLDDLQQRAFADQKFVLWDNNGTPVFLLNPDDNAIFIFTHFLKHFYKGGLGLRQICDWCRLLWVHKDVIDASLLEKRLTQMGLKSEWNSFAAFAVHYLGMDLSSMPLYKSGTRLNHRIKRIASFILDVGNFGHNRDPSYYTKHSYLVRKIISFAWRVKDTLRHMLIFPIDSIRFFPSIVLKGLRSAVRGVK